jgi:hypothetical protein
VKRLLERWEYTLYKIYIIVGFFGIAAVAIATSLLFDPHGMKGIALGVGAACTTAYFLGILAYWWFQFLFAGYGEIESLAEQPSEGTPEIKDLKSWRTLSESMAVHGGNVEEQIKLAKQTRRPIIIWFALVPTLGAILVLSNFWLGYFGIIPFGGDSNPVIYVVGALAYIVFAIVVTYILVGWSGGAAEAAYLKPLGLAIVETPTIGLGTAGGEVRHQVEGATVLGGVRRGRTVQIEAYGKYTYTFVQGNLPRFTVHSDEGKLAPGKNAPDAIVKSLKSLRKAKRWKGIELEAGSAGIAVERESRGQNMWLYDLWLAERLLEAMEGD